MYRIEREQIVNGRLDEVWDFFSDPRNLVKITPETMGFEILTNLPTEIHEGLHILYRVSPLPLYRTKWLSEITEVSPFESFVDEQKKGPYKYWRHEHTFESKGDDQVLMRDVVDYSLPFGSLGDLAHSMFVKSKLISIFDFRNQAVEKIFK